jgi:hypothetical protein
VCGYTCNTSFLQCTDGTCSRDVWDFETGDVQGWSAVDSSAGVANLTASTAQKFSGTYSLSVRNPAQNYDLSVSASLCSSMATNLTGKKLSLHFFLDFAVVNDFPANNQICINWFYSDGTPSSSACFSIMTNGWSQISRTFQDSPTKIAGVGVELFLFSGASDGSVGTMYLDDIQITN